MVQSQLERSEFEEKSKRKILMAKAYMVLAVLGFMLSIGGSFYIVETKGSATLQIAEGLRDNHQYVEAINEIKLELGNRQNQPVKYELATFLPDDENLTTLTRKFDDLFDEWNTTENPISNNSLIFGNSTVDEERGVQILPVTLTLQSSINNFQRFLQTIETSGLPGSNLRLMDIQSISLNLGTNNDEGMINYTVNLNAYFQS